MKFEIINPNKLFWFACILWFLLIYISISKKSFFNKGRLPLVTIFLRIISSGIILLLLLEPQLSFSTISKHDLNWHIYIDRSLSMSYHSNPSVGSLISGVDEIIGKLKKKMIDTKIFGFGSTLDTNWVYGEKKMQDGSTHFGNVMDHIKSQSNNKLAGSIIITDGQVNLGPEIPTKILADIKPINILGVGNNNPFVDVAIQSIEAPPVIIKGENAELNVIVSSSGSVEQKINITLYSEKRLLGSKVISISGEGSKQNIRFMINPDHVGEMKYRVQVNALPDEINILNNKQIVAIQVLKDIYKIAIISGAPNFNTRVIKNILENNTKFSFDHFVLQPDGYSLPLKTFWDTKYDLIIFDNHPVKMNAKEWQSYLRIFAKKILSQKSSLAIFKGHDTDGEVFASFLNLMGLEIEDSVIELESEYKWELTSNWESFSPFYINKINNRKSFDYPPLFIDTKIDSTNATVLANFKVSEMDVPLLLLAEKSPLRFMLWTSPDLHYLYYKTQNTANKEFLNNILKPVFLWLTRTSNEKEFYFRSGKNSYQQGEQITITGKPVRNTKIVNKGYVHVYNKESLINTKQLNYDKNKGIYTGQFWASESGKLDYDIELIYGEKPMIVHKGSVQVQESQIEMNNVFLNQYPLRKLAEITNGTYNHWHDRLSTVNQISKESENKIIQSRIIFHKSKTVFFIILALLSLEWLIRRRLGML